MSILFDVKLLTVMQFFSLGSYHSASLSLFIVIIYLLLGTNHFSLSNFQLVFEPDGGVLVDHLLVRTVRIHRAFVIFKHLEDRSQWHRLLVSCSHDRISLPDYGEANARVVLLFVRAMARAARSNCQNIAIDFASCYINQTKCI